MRNNMIIYKAKDGKEFTDRRDCDAHDWKLHLQELEAISKRGFIDKWMPAIIILAFLVGYFVGLLA